LETYIHSGIDVTFPDEIPFGFYQINETIKIGLLQKSVVIGKDISIKMQITNPNGYVGDISLSIYEMGVDHQLGNHHGNGWIDQEVFAHIEPKSIRIQKTNETVSFKIVPKTIGALYIIPQIKVNGKILIFDNNTELQMWSDEQRCMYSSNDFSYSGYQGDHRSTIPSMCVDDGYRNQASAQYNVQNIFIIIAITCTILCGIISGFDLYRRYKQGKEYLHLNTLANRNSKMKDRGHRSRKRFKSAK